MALSKNPKYDLKRTYNRVLQISFIISLSLLILAFKFFPDVETTILKTKIEEPPIDVVFIPPTENETKELPPPKPVILIEAPTDDILDDIEIDATIWNESDDVADPEARPATVEVIPDVIFVVVEQMPEPIGGIGAIQKKITYPEIARRAGVHGKVYVKAFVDEKGNVFKVELRKGIGGGCDEVAMAAVKSTLFYPGKQRGKAVKVQVTVPINFKLQ